MVILDTCTLLWLAADAKKLSEKAKRTITTNSSALSVSAISGFEVAIKHRSKKLTLPLPPQQWFSEALLFHGIHEIPVTSSVAIASVQLPLLHNDPCDRIIMATARIHSLTVITCDRLIAQYDDVEVVW